MSLDAGNGACSSGMSQRIYQAMTADTVGAGFGVANEAALTSVARAAIKAICYAVAQGVVAEIAAHAVASIIITGTDPGTGAPTSTTYTGTVT